MKSLCETSILPIVRASELDQANPQNDWLVESLLARTGVSICGGAPKCCKSWMGLDLALSVASGTPCLDRFPVKENGPTLIYLAEDPPPIVRKRLEGLCAHRGLDLAAMPIDVITSPTLRLDLARDQERLRNTIRTQRPRLVLLDPFVRLHRVNENDAGEVSALLAFLRELQRENNTCILVVHHARKSGTAGAQAGQGLRGSGDFYAFVDGLLYLRRYHNRLLLQVEHRAAAAPPNIDLALIGEQHKLHLCITSGARPQESEPKSGRNLEASIFRVLNQTQGAMSLPQLRAALHLKTELIQQALVRLEAQGAVTRTGNDWSRDAPDLSPINAHRAPSDTRPSLP